MLFASTKGKAQDRSLWTFLLVLPFSRLVLKWTCSTPSQGHSARRGRAKVCNYTTDGILSSGQASMSPVLTSCSAVADPLRATAVKFLSKTCDSTEAPHRSTPPSPCILASDIVPVNGSRNLSGSEKLLFRSSAVDFAVQRAKGRRTEMRWRNQHHTINTICCNE